MTTFKLAASVVQLSSTHRLLHQFAEWHGHSKQDQAASMRQHFAFVPLGRSTRAGVESAQRGAPVTNATVIISTEKNCYPPPRSERR